MRTNRPVLGIAVASATWYHSRGTISVVCAFRQPPVPSIPGGCASGWHRVSADALTGRGESNNVRFSQFDGDIASSATTSRKRQRRGGSELHGSVSDPSSAPGKKRKRKASVKQSIEIWSEESLELHRFHQKRVHVCKATTLPEVLSDFWSLTAEYAQAKYAAMADDRDYAAHLLFVAADCDLLKDYGMMRQLDKVLDFCSGGCRDFGRTLTLQHYHPDFALPPSRDRENQQSSDLTRMINFSRSPYPSFGLTVAGGSACRTDPLQKGDSVGRLRLDLEMVYNSASGCSTGDSVDAHGSEHSMLPSSPEEVKDKTTAWLSKLRASREEEQKRLADSLSGAAVGEKESSSLVGGVDNGPAKISSPNNYGRYLGEAGDFVTSGLSTPEEVLSQVWSIVTQLQGAVAPILPETRDASSLNVGITESTDSIPPQHKTAEDSGLAGEQGGPTDGEDSDGLGTMKPLRSTLLVAPRLHPFNAAQFDNFARTLAIALKQTPIMDRIEVEVFHPEFVSDGGVVDVDRRSPYPTLFVKHCGLKDQLFEPSGMYRHAVPPLKLPSEASSPPTSPTDGETASDVSADDAQL